MFPCEGMYVDLTPKAAVTLKDIFAGLVVVATAEQVTLSSEKLGVSEKTTVMYCSIYAQVLSLADAKF